MINKKQIDNLPSSCGVYFFKKGGQYLYVGKSVNIKARVKSHLENAKLNPKEALIVNGSDRVDFIRTDSEFKAIILEAKLIKEYHPKFNTIWKDDKNFLYIKITIGEEYPKIFLSRKKDDVKSLYFGPFSSVKTTFALIREIRKIVPFCMEETLMSGPCFYSKIGLCSPCPGEIVAEKNGLKKRRLKKIYRQNILKVIKLLHGKTHLIIRDFNRQLKNKIKEENFEEAILLRNKILQLQSLERLSFFEIDNEQKNHTKLALESLFLLLKPYFNNIKKLERIEGYDVSNLFGDYATASMTVLINGQINKSQFRRFKIKNLKRNDSEMLEEVFKRRFSQKDGWPDPDLIVVDGGRPQVKLLIKILKKLKIDIPLIGIAKNPDRLVLGIKFFPTIKPSSNDLGFNLIKLLRDESHRFAHKYHLLLRKKAMKLS